MSSRSSEGFRLLPKIGARRTTRRAVLTWPRTRWNFRHYVEPAPCPAPQTLRFMNPNVEVFTQLSPLSRLRVATKLVAQGLTLAGSVILPEAWSRRQIEKQFPFGVVLSEKTPGAIVVFPGAD